MQFQINKLPDEIIQLTITFLPVKELVTCTLDSKKFNNMANQDYIWKERCRKRWEDKPYYRLTPQREKKFKAMYIPWKEIYFTQERDSRRIRIKEREVYEMEWQLIFKHAPMMMYRGEETHYPLFTADHKFYMDGYPSFVWRLTENHGIQVNEFPEHACTRRYNDWGWDLSNHYVTISSIDPEVKQKQIEEAKKKKKEEEEEKKLKQRQQQQQQQKKYHNY